MTTTTRTVTSPRPDAPYNTNAYLILYYGRMIKRPFTSQELKDVFRGRFPANRIDDASGPASRMAQKGYLKKLAPHKWQITPAGLEELTRSLAYYREAQWRNLGVSYMQAIAERNAKARMNVSLDDQLDEEEIILNEIDAKIQARTLIKKNSKKSKS